MRDNLVQGNRLMNPNMVYSWEMETVDGVILKQYEENGKENTWKNLDVSKIVRVSFIPCIPILPRHELLIDIDQGDRFVRRFGRGFIKHDKADGFGLKIYLNCIVTNRCRFYVISNGRAVCTHRDHDIYL